MSIRIYVEGGAPGILSVSCRRAFNSFLGKVISPRSFEVIACGSRQRAFEMFRLALDRHRDKFVLLVVDAEEEVITDVWEHLHRRTGDHWVRPDGTEDNQAHLMAQVMESWFLADPEVLATYFGNGFRKSALPRRTDIERISKRVVYQGLNSAARDTKKREYKKGRDSFASLEKITPQLVRVAAPHAERLFATLERQTTSS